MKAARRRAIREEAERRQREQELKRQQEELKAGGGSFRERQLLQMAQAAEQSQADALQRLMVERAAKQKAMEEAKERQRIADIKALEAAQQAKLERDAHLAELNEDTHWRKSRAKYFGKFADSPSKTMRHGWGEFTWSHGGRVYEGAYEWDRMQGEGLYEWENGDTWEGSFYDDEMHGVGKYTCKATGKQCYHFYCHGNFVCNRDMMLPGTRICINEANGSGSTKKVYYTLCHAATNAPSHKAFKKGTWMLQNLDSVLWRDLSHLTWHLVQDSPNCTSWQVSEEPKRANEVFTSPSVGDAIAMATDRDTDFSKRKLPLMPHFGQGYFL